MFTRKEEDDMWRDFLQTTNNEAYMRVHMATWLGELLHFLTHGSMHTHGEM